MFTTASSSPSARSATDGGPSPAPGRFGVDGASGLSTTVVLPPSTGGAGRAGTASCAASPVAGADSPAAGGVPGPACGATGASAGGTGAASGTAGLSSDDGGVGISAGGGFVPPGVCGAAGSAGAASAPGAGALGADPASCASAPWISDRASTLAPKAAPMRRPSLILPAKGISIDGEEVGVLRTVIACPFAAVGGVAACARSATPARSHGSTERNRKPCANQEGCDDLSTR